MIKKYGCSRRYIIESHQLGLAIDIVPGKTMIDHLSIKRLKLIVVHTTGFGIMP
jgi:hypothetical protein